MSYSTGTQLGAQIAQSTPNVSALDEIRAKLMECHQTVSDIHEIADRACGIRGEAASAKPSPVSNGLLDEVLDALSGLNERLNGAASRLSRIA